MKIIFESTQLNEDKVVKFDGQTFPKFGWAVILMGGGGSGKSTVFERLIPIEGKYMNTDMLKENPRFWDITPTEKDKETGEWKRTDTTYAKIIQNKVESDEYADMYHGEPIRYDSMGYYFGQDEDKEVPRRPILRANLSGPAISDATHKGIKPLSTKLKQRAYNTPKYSNPERLPNIIFDIVADEMKDIETIVNALKPAGYKIAIVWVSSTVCKAIKNNANRPRFVNLATLVGAHGRVIDTVDTLFESGYISNIDEFWIVDTAIPNKYFKNKGQYHDYQNVFKVPTVKGGLAMLVDNYKGNPNWNQSWNSPEGKTYSNAKSLNAVNRMRNQKADVKRWKQQYPENK